MITAKPSEVSRLRLRAAAVALERKMGTTEYKQNMHTTNPEMLSPE